MGCPSLLPAVCLGTLLLALPAVSTEIDAARLAAELAAAGPRVSGSSGHREAVRLLLTAMSTAGLSQVALHRVDDHPDLVRLEGVLPGESGREILLTAHLDTVAGSPGAADNAAACATVIAAVARLAEMPRHHQVRVLLFDGEERGLLGSSAWVGSLDRQARAAVLAAVNLDLIGWHEAPGGAVLTPLTEMLPAEQPGRRRVAPGWLVSAALEASGSVGRPLGVSASSAGLVGQLLSRTVFLRTASDSEALLAAGVPAITLSESDLFRTDPMNHGPNDVALRLNAAGLELWVDRLGALVLRLDTLAGRPRDDDQYVALFGRVWSRRDLYWVGLVVWVMLVLQGLRGVRRGQTRRSRRSYLPGFALRFLILGSVLMLPVLTVVLVVPAALVLLLPRRWPLAPRWKLTVACAPLVLVLVALVRLTSVAQVESFALGLPATALLAMAFGSILWVLAAETPEPGQTARASSASVETASSHSSTEL